MSWQEVFRRFYDDNEAGGSSRWLVTPMTVEIFIKGLLMEPIKGEIYKRAEKLQEDILSGKFGTKNRSQLLLQIGDLIATIEKEFRQSIIKEPRERF